MGSDPFDVKLVTKLYASKCRGARTGISFTDDSPLAGLDDCDFNMHLSNSSYSKSVDTTRMHAATEVFGPLLTEGVWVAL